MAIINILLLIFGLIGTLAAFGGDTWDKGNEKLITRITKRGWLALSTLLLAFGFGVTKEIITNREGKANEVKQRELEQSNVELTSNLMTLRDSIGLLKSELLNTTVAVENASKKVENTGIKVEESVNDLKRTIIIQLEEAFKLTENIEREYDDWVINVRGQASMSIPGRKTNPMELYWGDTFEFTFLDNDYRGDVEELKTLKLEVDGRKYDLHDGEEGVFKHGSVRIYGKSPRPMNGIILNPSSLSGFEIKIFVRSTDATRGQEDFRKMILTSEYSELAKKIYKVTSADILRIRSESNANSQIRSTLKKGSFVRVLQTQDEWCEVTTPKDRQGWVKCQFLEDIK